MLNDVVPARMDSGRSSGIWVAAALGAVLSIALLYPGQYPFDSAYQWWQARTGNYNNLSPVTLPLLWSALLATGIGPAGLLVLNLLLFWSGLALIADALRGPVAWRIGLLALCGGSPLVLVELAHLLSDAHLAAVLTVTCGLCADAAVRGRPRTWLIAALLIYAGTIRLNALLAILPFGVLLATALPRALRVRGIVAVLALAVASVLFGVVLDRSFVVDRKTTWTPLAVWDLAAISVDAGEIFLPDFTHGPGLTVSELIETHAFDPVSNIYLFMRSRSGIGAGLVVPFTAVEQQALRDHWWSAVREHPLAYLHHRLRTFRLLAGWPDGDLRGIAFLQQRTPYLDNPPLPVPLAASAQTRIYALADSLALRGWLSAIPSLLLAALAAALGWLRHRHAVAVVGGVAAMSALLYAASFLLLAPGAELRYLTWPIVIAPLALALVLAGRTPSRD